MRESMSAIGSVIIAIAPLPTGLGHAGDDALMGELPQADPADPELAVHGARPSAAIAPRVCAHLELLRPLLFHDQRSLCHLLLPSFTGEREAEAAEQRPRLVVRLGGGRDR